MLTKRHFNYSSDNWYFRPIVLYYFVKKNKGVKYRNFPYATDSHTTTKLATRSVTKRSRVRNTQNNEIHDDTEPSGN